MEYQITPMTAAHLEQVAAMELACFPEEPWSKKLFEECLTEDQSCVLLAQTGDGTVLGYIVFTTVLDECDIDNIAVSQDMRRLGIASSLLAAAHRAGQERGVVRFFLDVRPSNQSARALYEKFGYVEVGRRKNYYFSPKEDAIIMKLELTPCA